MPASLETCDDIATLTHQAGNGLRALAGDKHIGNLILVTVNGLSRLLLGDNLFGSLGADVAANIATGEEIASCCILDNLNLVSKVTCRTTFGNDDFLILFHNLRFLDFKLFIKLAEGEIPGSGGSKPQRSWERRGAGGLVSA